MMMETQSLERVSAVYVRKKKRCKCCRDKCIRLFSLSAYVLYICVNMWTVLLFSARSIDKCSSEIMFKTVMVWNIIHTLSLFPEMCIGINEKCAMKLRSVCTFVGCIVQTVFWHIWGFIDHLWIVYLCCCFLFLFEVVYCETSHKDVLPTSSVHRR